MNNTILQNRTLEQQLEGLVVLSVQGHNPVSILTLLAEDAIPLFQVKTAKDTLYFSIYLHDFKRTKHLLRMHHIRFRISEKRGLPFLFHRMKRRTGVWLGILAGILLWQFSGLFLWNYEVSGNERYTDAQIIAMVQGYDLWPGTRLADIDCALIEHTMIMDYPEFSWVQLQPVGTTLCISVKERLADKADLATCGSIVAKTDGKITELLIYTGTALVTEGESVSAGQVLIGGWDYSERIRNANGDFVDVGTPYAVCAKGEIYAQTQHHAIGVCALEETAFVKTGNTEQCKKFFWEERSLFSLGEAQSPYQYSEEHREVHALFQWGAWQCPLKICTVLYEEQIAVHQVFTKEEAYQTALDRARAQLKERVPKDAAFVRESSGQTVSPEQDTVQVEVIWVVEEAIGRRQQVPIPETSLPELQKN